MHNTPATLYNPWTQAAQLAQQIATPGTLLVVVIGAQAWCQRCRDFYPLFIEQASQAPNSSVFCWLDIEEHQEFLGDYVPDNLPWLCLYQDQQLIASSEVTPAGLVQQWQAAPQQTASAGLDPGILARLIKTDWAT